MNNKTIMKGAGVLLLTAVLLLSATAVTANTTKLTTSFNANTQAKGHQNNRDVLWDNGGYTTNALSSQLDTAYPFNSQVADDFQFSTGQTVTEIIFWGFWWNGAPPWPDPITLNIIFYADDGSGNQPTGAGMADPTSTALLLDTHAGVSGVDNGDGSFTYDIVLNTPFTANAGTKYWVVTQWAGDFPPQWGWCVSDSQQLHVCDQGFPLLGTNYWTPMTTYGDVSFQLIGGAPHDTTPPVTSASFSGTNPVTVTITATDDMSGVNHTYYNLDSAGYVEYAAPFDVSVAGNHTIMVYSTDKAGNSETPHSYPFTVAPPPITITIKKGLGVTAVIKNTGTATLTNIDWKIDLTGGIIIIGKSKTGTIASLAPAATFNAKDFVFGFGKITIAATAGGASASGSGTVILILVI